MNRRKNAMDRWFEKYKPVKPRRTLPDEEALSNIPEDLIELVEMAQRLEGGNA